MNSERLFSPRSEWLFHGSIACQLIVSSFLDPGVIGFGILCSVIGINFLKTMVKKKDFDESLAPANLGSTMIAGEVFARSGNEEEEDDRALRVGGFGQVLKRRIFLSGTIIFLSLVAFKLKLQPPLLVWSCLGMVGFIGVAHRRAMLVLPQLFHVMLAFMKIDHWLTLALFLTLALPIFLLFCRSIRGDVEESWGVQLQKIFKDYLFICLLGTGCHQVLPMDIQNYLPKGLLARKFHQSCQNMAKRLQPNNISQHRPLISGAGANYQQLQNHLNELQKNSEDLKKLLQEFPMAQWKPASEQIIEGQSLRPIGQNFAQLEKGLGNFQQSLENLKNLKMRWDSLTEDERKEALAQVTQSQQEMAAKLQKFNSEIQKLSSEENQAETNLLSQNLKRMEQNFSAKATQIDPAETKQKPPPDEKKWWQKVNFGHLKKALLIILVFLLLQLLVGTKTKEEDLPYGVDRKTIQNLRHKLRALWLSAKNSEQKIIESYNLWCEFCREIYFTEEEVPPSDILANQLRVKIPKLTNELQLVTRQFNRVFYGRVSIDAGGLKQYRKSLDAILKRTLSKY